MAIGDPWDTSYNPNIKDLKNQVTGFPAWEPDNSDNVPQIDPLVLKDRRIGRFCTEGCGCVDTYSSNLAGSKCVLPPELAVTIMRTPDGRYEARSAISGGEGETYHLKFSGGVWRGSKCCSHNSHGELLYACDPCKVTTLPNNKPSECHHANNKYKTLTSDNQVDDGFPNRGPWDYNSAIGKGNSSDTIWPRRGADSWMQASVYDQVLPNDGVAMYSDPKNQEVVLHQSEFSANHLNARTNIKAREKTILVDPDGYLANYTVDNGSSPDPKISDTEIYYPNDGASLIGCLEDGSIPIQKRPWCRNAVNGQRIQQRCYDSSLEGRCLDENDQNTGDADKPSCDKRRAEGANVRWEEDPDGQPLYGDKASCVAAGEQWLYDDKEGCLLSGACQSPEGETLEAGCFKDDGTPVEKHRNQKSCEQALLDWRYSLPETCTKYYGHELAKCKSVTGEDIKDDKAECEENGHIWYENKPSLNEWVDWEYERRSCCGNVILDESHPFHTPQISGGAAETRKSTTCFTPYSEVILTPNTMSGTDAPMSFSGGEGLSIGNQADRDWFFNDQSAYWTLVIRPCNFWGSCFEEGKTRKDPAEMGECRDENNKVITKGKYSSGYGRCEEETKGLALYDTEQKCTDYEKTVLGNTNRETDTAAVISWNEEGNRTDNEERCTENNGKWVESPDNHYETTCGEEVVLFLPVDQFMNCSDFNLTLSQEEGLRSGWPESHAGWDQTMGNLMGNPAGSETGATEFPLVGATYGGRGFPGDAIEGIQHKKWCDHPDSNWDGVADGGVCSQYTYWNANGGSHYHELQNAKGADAFYGFNIQPQPFKATEEKQSRAKDMHQAAGDKKHWQMCASNGVSWGGGGHWFWEYGPDYFFYFDFVKWDEVGISGKAGSAQYTHIKSGGTCSAVGSKAESWIQSHVGQLGRGSCPANPPLYVGWIEQSSFEKICPQCETEAKAGPCGELGSCEHPDGTFDKGLKEAECLENGKCYGPTGEIINGVNTEDACEAYEKGSWRSSEFKTCCEWIEGCTLTGSEGGIEGEVIIGYDGSIPITRPAKDKEECEKDKVYQEPFDGGAEAIWYERCIPSKKMLDSLSDCPPIGAIPDGLLDIVLGDQVGTCVLHKDNGKCEKKREAQCDKPEVPEVPAYCDRSVPAICSDVGEAYCKRIVDGQESSSIDPYCDGVMSHGLCWCNGSDTPAEDSIPIEDKATCVAFGQEGGCGSGLLSGSVWLETGDSCSSLGQCEHVDGCDSSWNYNLFCGENETACESSPCTDATEPGTGKTVTSSEWKDFRTCDDQASCIKAKVDTGGVTTDGCGGEWTDEKICTNEGNCEAAAGGFGGCGGNWVPPVSAITCSTQSICEDETKCNSKWQPERECTTRQECVSKDGCDSAWVGKNDSIDDFENASISPMTAEECGKEAIKDKYIEWNEDGHISPRFSPDTVGSSDSTYTVRENDIVKLRPAGPATSNLPDVTAIKDGKLNDYYETEFGLKRRLRLPAGDDVGHSMSYWHQTGLWPRGELSSYVNDHCQGLTQHRRIINASNEKPIQITARNHLLQDGDLVNIDGVMGNFGANVMTTRDWTEMQWEDKIYKECKGENCEDQMWPDSICAETTQCLDEDGQEVPGKDPLTCSAGECDKKKPNGNACQNETECKAEVGTNTAQDADGNCPYGYTKDSDKGPYEKDGCINDLAGCGGAWTSGAGNTWTTFCDSEKFFACEGAVVGGKDPPPARFFVVKNITVDTFDLYTCDKHPVDGRIKNKINLNTEDCPDDSPMVCAANPGMATYERIVTSAKYTVYKDDSGLPAIYPFVPRCIDTDDKDVTPAAAEKDCVSPNRWITERDLQDNPETKKVEGEAFCSGYGTCMVVDNAFGVDDSFMTKDDCFLLAETYHTYPGTGSGGTSGKKRHVRECVAGDGSTDASQHATKNQEACEAMHSMCLDENDQNTGDADKASCDRRKEFGQNVRWVPATLSVSYNDCAEQADATLPANLDACWIEAQWKSLADVDISARDSSNASFGVPNVGVYQVCPFTGDMVFVNSQQDPGIEAGYVSHLGQDTLDDMYRFGYGGPGYKWEDRANDYYVQIEQKGICPVCCDHFMPPNLTASLTGQPSEILNLIGCGFDECANGPLHDGWCCSDGMHSCDMSGLADCEKNPETFGRCQGEDGRDLTFVGATRTPACEKAGGTFTPMPELEEFKHGEPKSHCNMFLRKMMVHHTTNCRRCSDVYSSQNKVPLYDGPPGPVDYNGESCCPGCECLYNESDNSTIGCNYEYPTCAEVLACIRGEDISCNSETEGMVKEVGKVTATCTNTEPEVSTGFYRWVMEPCSCFPQHVAMSCMPEIVHGGPPDGSCDYNGKIPCPDGTVGGCYDNRGGCRDTDENIVDGKSRKEDRATEKDCNTAAKGFTGQNVETWFEGSSGCPATHITTDADESCYDVPNSPKAVEETCPGLGTMSMPLKYDGVVWRSEWTIMNTVGTHQCDLGQHRFHWPQNCQHTGPPSDECPDFVPADTLVAVNADCDACDMSQSGMAGRPIDALADCGTPRRHRNIKAPTLPQDGHFIRIVMGCGGSIPSILAYTDSDGRILDGGFNSADDYRNSGITIWAEITNCTFVDFMGSETLRAGRSDTGTSGAPPIYQRGCFSKKDVVGGSLVAPRIGEPPNPVSALERKYTFAGRCMNSATSGPQGPCVDTECCTYNNRDVPLAVSGPLWSGAVACSQGGDIKHDCSVLGMDVFPEKPPEQFTVYYVKDVDPVTGEGTLVVRAYPAGWEHCEHATLGANTNENLSSYEKKATVGIGVANLADAEQDTLGSYSRSNKSLNPYLPAGGTSITGCRTSLRKSYYGEHKTEYTDHEGIPYGNNPADENGDRGRGNGEFMEVKVANIAPLITKNPRKSRHLRIYDRSRMVEGEGSDEQGNPIQTRESADTLEDMNMLLNLDMAQPYGLNPWPVDHQTHSSPYSKWPKGIVMGPHNTESLRKDVTGTLNQPGRVGPMPTMDNLNRMFRFTEEADGSGTTTTPVPEILPVAPVAINEFNNVYSEEDGFCTDPRFKSKDSCTDNGHIWVPKFLYTKVTTHEAHDLHDGEKVVISGSVTYPATCKGSRMGFCQGGMGLDINECNKGECIDTQIGASSPWVKDDQGNVIDNEADCAMASQTKQQSATGGNPMDERPLPPDLVFKPNGLWVQVFEHSDADKHICEEVFEGVWVVGQVNDTKDGKGVYEDPLNLKPLKLEDKEKGFSQGCPVGCRLNGFYLTDPCQPPSDDFPQGQCFECVEVGTYEKPEFRCPLGPADGNYVVRKRGCQHSGYTTKKDCEYGGWFWFGDLPPDDNGEQFDFALHGEMNPFAAAHDASVLRSDLAEFRPESITPNAEKLDWVYDLSNVEHAMPEDEEACDALSHAGFAWMDGGEEGGINAKFKSNKLSSFKTTGVGDSASDSRRKEQSLYDNWLTKYTTGSCIDTRKLDKEFPHLFEPDVKKMSVREKIDQGISTAHEQIQFSNLLSICRSTGACFYGSKYEKCLGEADDHYGECMKLGSNGEVLKDYIQKQDCPASSVWVGPNLHLDEPTCSKIALEDEVIDPDIPTVHHVGAELKIKATISAVCTVNDEKSMLIATAEVDSLSTLEIGGKSELEASGWSEAWGTLYKLGQSTLNASATVAVQGTLTKFGRTGDDGINATATIKPVPSDSSGTPSTSNSRLNATSTISATGTGGTESTPN